MEKNKTIELTRAGKAEYEAELNRRINEDRPRITAAIAEARAQGDLSENADYSAAKEEQANNEQRIKEIQELLKNVKIVDAIKIKVHYIDLKKDFEGLIAGSESNLSQNKISNESPLGKACLAHEVGETFVIKNAAGEDLKVKLLEKK